MGHPSSRHPNPSDFITKARMDATSSSYVSKVVGVCHHHQKPQGFPHHVNPPKRVSSSYLQ
jgi:hypothetical protein